MAETQSTLREPFLSPIDTRDDEENQRYQHFFYLSNEEVEHESHSCTEDLDSHSSGSGSSIYFPPDILRLAKRNVRKTLSLTFFSFLSRSIWSQGVLSTFVVLVWKDSPAYVGYALATTGMFQIISSIATRYATRCSDYIANRIETLLQLASIIGFFIPAIFFFAVKAQGFPFFLLANALWGTLLGVMDSALPIVFSEWTGTDPKTTTLKYRMCHNLVRLGNIAGTLLTLALFAALGNTWTIENCYTVMMVGLGCNLPVLFLMVTLKSITFAWGEDLSSESLEPEDYNVLAQTDEEQYYNDITEHESQSPSWNEDETDDNFIVEGTSIENIFFGAEVGEATEDSSEKTWTAVWRTDKIRVPILIHISDMFSSIAGGMSIGYFPVYLMQRSKLEPVSIQFMYLIIPLGQWMTPLLAKALSKAIGPCRACVSLQWVYILSLLSMIACQWNGYPVWMVCTLYVFHGSLMNSTSSLSKAMVLQHVPAEDQHKWMVVENAQMLLWSCAGLLGGCIVDRYGLVVNFFVTAVLQFLASAPLAALNYLLEPPLDTVRTPTEAEMDESIDSSYDCDDEINTSLCCGSYLQSKASSNSVGGYRIEALSPSTQATEIDFDSPREITTISIHVV
ncbi:unnamed protein product [Pseudo-nitzschia multistriata]|uniref:Major facilitator superfamily (MFS) profile domain-containing protein n=1 Tax=Pseudo-nitzschia multistriata TaxID=183589 RepID=A0A448YU77_9STRA|nr:unnamed protein product [Pseudo-nitzschia multistriata]